MSIGGSVALIVIGAILRFAVTYHAKYVNIQAIGVILMIDLRMLGVMKDVAFPALHRLLPWAILGFGTNLVTGMLFFVASPEQYVGNIAFVWKMILVMLAGANALYFTLFEEAWVLKAGDDAPFTAKAVAVSAIALWLGVLYFGSMLPFIGNSF